MNFPKLAVAGHALILLSGLVCAQNALDNLDWVEEKEPPAPAFSVTKVLPLEMPNFVTVKVGIDPNTIYVGNDGIVRYVAVMTNSTGTSHAVYEGIRCLTGEVKTYARAGSSGTWSPVATPVWRDLMDNMGSQHPRMFARQAACYARVTVSKPEIIKALQTGIKPGNQKNDNPA
ncbi:CNP1-like family protein [Rhodoferax mekongensis]|uniref:CNP1-like family protein n=1 Tax=Rhodoferax mekongensis TaxID=3068341 RepID=UPI0028BDEBF7|nr:CNP1-like family protein [Rhodoferax sp. TBRC 17199]MDT7516433.1 CNP1-like family protein [Rhodoferax sp. TBRC 17199]